MTQEDSSCVGWQNIVQLTEELQVNVFREMAFVAYDPIWRFASDSRQLATLAQHNATHQRCQGGQHSRGIAFQFAWIQLHDCLLDGRIHSMIVTHGYTPVLPWPENLCS